MTARAVAFLAAMSLAACASTSPTPAPGREGSPTAAASLAPASTATASRTVPPTTPATGTPAPKTLVMETYPVTPGSAPHDVAPAADGGVWYTGQGNGTLGWLDPDTGDVREISLGAGSAPHGVIVGPDGAPWVTDGGLNAIVRVDASTEAVTRYPLSVPNANLNTATFDGDGTLWFTGQNGWYGSVDPDSGEVTTFSAPRRIGPYGIATMPNGEVVFSSLAGSYLGFIDRTSGEVEVVDTPTPSGGARRVWSDSAGRLWVTEWFAGTLAAYDPATSAWDEWVLPGDAPQPYAVYVDASDIVWVTDFGANALLRFDPAAETWTSFPHGLNDASVRQLLGRDGEVWGAESALDRLVVIRPES
jgi:virginiamycin B lyase